MICSRREFAELKENKEEKKVGSNGKSRRMHLMICVFEESKMKHNAFTSQPIPYMP